MSRATELAEAEATRAEAEEPETPETEPETPGPDEDEEQEAEEQEQPAAPETPGEPPVTEARLKSITAKRDAEDERHEKRLRQIMGDLFEGHEVCPLCLATGWLVPFEPGTFDPGQKLAVEAAMGAGAAPEYREHPTEKRCQTCDGWGEMTNGSRRDGALLSLCPDCMGTGHLTQVTQTNVTPMPVVSYQPPAFPTPNPLAGPNFDAWNRPPGHPDWGRDPAQVNAYGA